MYILILGLHRSCRLRAIGEASKDVKALGEGSKSVESRKSVNVLEVEDLTYALKKLTRMVLFLS
jgi:hypothetical protein